MSSDQWKMLIQLIALQDPKLALQNDAARALSDFNARSMGEPLYNCVIQNMDEIRKYMLQSINISSVCFKWENEDTMYAPTMIVVSARNPDQVYYRWTKRESNVLNMWITEESEGRRAIDTTAVPQTWVPTSAYHLESLEQRGGSRRRPPATSPYAW